MHKNQPRQESNQALLARIKKEMDEPRMAESAREEYDVNHTTLQELKKAAVIRGNECRGRPGAGRYSEGRKRMAKLTKAARDGISATKFAFPRQRKEPLENASHVLPSGEGRYGGGTSCGVEADTVCRQAIRSGT
jgi:hypothetical protein